MTDLQKRLESYENLFFQELEQIREIAQLETVRIKHLSRHGMLAELMHHIKDLSLEDKQLFGPRVNALKEKVQEAFKNKEVALEQERLSREHVRNIHFDVTSYRTVKSGSLHPYTLTIQKVEDILISMGFEIIEGPEVDDEYYNFEALNIPADHPARDMQDTFWLTIPGLLMRTHTSSVEIHTLLKKKPPLAVAVPGRAYRNEATDASHDFMFMQLEGLLVDKGISLSHLFATMKNFLQVFFEKKDLQIRLRPSYFPFVEPGVEIDMSCTFCASGCSVCKKSGWIEICGAGLVHPQVLKACAVDPTIYSGFAFGFGLTRLVMLKYGITDIRLLHSNKVEFLQQF